MLFSYLFMDVFSYAEIELDSAYLMFMNYLSTIFISKCNCILWKFPHSEFAHVKPFFKQLCEVCPRSAKL